jgi:hypothetical protein
MDLSLVFHLDVLPDQLIHAYRLVPQGQLVLYRFLVRGAHFPDISYHFHHPNIQNSNIFLFFYYYVLHGITFFIYLCIIILLALAYIMKNIVLYIIIILSVTLAVAPVNAQKPVIELLPFDQQIQYPKALVDTIYPGEYINWQDSIADSSLNQQNTLHLHHKRDEPQKRTGWNFRIFQSKRGSDREERSSRTENRMRFFRSIHPVHLFFKITALK